jgi:hypothetical protein
MREPGHLGTTIKDGQGRWDKTQGFWTAGCSVFVAEMGKLMATRIPQLANNRVGE